MIGFSTRQAFISNSLLTIEGAKVVRCYRNFYNLAYEYAVSYLPLGSEVLNRVEVFQVANRDGQGLRA